MKTKQKLTAFLLSAVIAFQSMPILATANAVTTDSVGSAVSESNSENESQIIVVDSNGNQIDLLSLSQADNEKIRVKNDDSSASYQWQIRDNSEADTWVDIKGQTESELYVSNALINSVLETYDTAYVRCKITVGEDVSYSSVVKLTKNANSDSNDSAQTTKRATVKKESNNVEPVGADDDKTIYTITINYLDAQDKTSIFSSYVAHVEDGTEFTQKVISPTFLGFTPFYDSDNLSTDNPDDATEDASVLNANIQSVSSDIVFNVYYKASDVDYQIAYWFQNINDDEYTEKTELRYHGREKTGAIISDETIAEHAGDLTGFSALYHYPEAVAADGSTVFYCYYDRNYYMLKFDTDGGYGVDPIFARYDTPFVVTDPVRPGYTFVGWDLLTDDTDGDGAVDTGDGVPDVLPSTVPAENQKYKAIWKTAKTNFTVVYWKENADDSGYSYWGSDTSNTAESASYVDGKDYKDLPSSLKTDDYQQFYYHHADTSVFVNSDGSTFVNVYYNRQKYTITFTGLNRSWTSDVTGHTHSFNDCYELTCEKEEHTHTAECGITCGKVEHTHNEECCSKAVHPHTITCYTSTTGGYTRASSLSSGTQYTVYNNYIKNISSPQAGYVYRYLTNSYYNFFYDGHEWWYLGTGTQYRGLTYTGSNPSRNSYRASTTGNSTICGETEHAHGDGTCNSDNCSVGYEHTHGPSCYSCGKEEHTHSLENGCYTLTCDKLETTVGTTTYTVTAKYGADIRDVWENAPIKNAIDAGYVFRSSLTGNYYSFLQLMANQSFTMTATSWSGSQYSWDYYLEVPEGMDTTQYTTKTVDGKTYYIYHTTTIFGSGLSLTYDEDYFDIVGYTQRDSDVPSFDSNRHAELYYNLSSYSLEFINAGGTSLSTETIQYLASLDSHVEAIGTPPYPNNLEPNAYEFAGWYTTQELIDGTEYKEGSKMPASNMALYAKWVPVTHTVRFFETYKQLQQYEEDSSKTDGLLETREVPQGSYVGSIDNPTHEVSGQPMTFGGWFYIDSDGSKKAFTPLDYPVKKNMNVFADWGTHSPQPYRIEYVYKNTQEKIADNTTGYAYGGSTKTFTAKAGDPYNQLYDGYNQGYFPTVSSHSITMDFEQTGVTPETATLNTYTFEYVHAENVEYTVRYVDKNTGATLKDDEHITTNSSVVTERFAAIEGYVPDKFYKRLVLAVEDDGTGTYVGSKDNVITFYYTTNTQSAYYAVHFMQQKEGVTSTTNYAVDGSGDYTERNTTYIDGIGDINSIQQITPMDFTGFSLVTDHGVQVTDNGTNVLSMDSDGYFNISITQGGTELYLFYVRNNYDYTVKYLEYGTSNELATEDSGTAPFDSTISFDAKDISGYTCVSATTQSITIRNTNANLLIFYYSPIQYTVQYKIIDENNTIINGISSDCGKLNRTIEVIEGQDSLLGASATANEGYRFVGWFADSSCDTTVADSGKASVDGNSINPIREKLTPNNANGNIFYAKFVKDEKLEFAINHTLNPNSTDTDSQTFVSAKILDENNNTLAEYDNNSSSVTVENDYLKYGRGYKLQITLTTKLSDGGIFADFYYGDTSLSETDFGASYNKNSLDDVNTTFEISVDDLLDYDSKFDVATLKQSSYDFTSLVNNAEYSIDYQFKTRQYGDKVYNISGKLSTADLKKYFAYEVADGNLTKLKNSFIIDNVPEESNFMQSISWDEIDIDIDGFTANWIAVQEDKQVTAVIYSKVNVDGTPDVRSKQTITTDYKGLFTQEDGNFVQVDKSNQSECFSYWQIFAINADLSDLENAKPLAQCYSEYFNYGALSDYIVIPKFGDGENTSYITQEKGLTTTYARFLGVTRNHWNNTVSGEDDGTGKYDKADTEYDRLYADFDIQFLYKGEIISQHTDSNTVEVGIDLDVYSDDTLVNTKDFKIATSRLSNKNRIEYFISFANTEQNLSYVFHAKPYVMVNGEKYYNSDSELVFNLNDRVDGNDN